MKEKSDISVVVPVYNERDCLRQIYKEIAAALEGKFSFEVIFIDDGSSDGSFAVLKGIQESDPRVRVVQLRRNFGQTAAMSAGFDHCRGRIIIPCDADGQNDPSDIPRLIEKLNEGYDIVSGWRKDRKDRTLSRKIPSKVANFVIGRVTGVRLNDYGCTLKAYRREIIDEVQLYGEMHRFIPAVADWAGAKITEIQVNHRPRLTGSSNYGFERTGKVLLDLLTVKFIGSYSTKPLHIFGGIGALSLVGSVVSGLVVLYMKYLHPMRLSMNRNPLLILTAILMITAVQFILMGLLAEMIVRTYHESQNRAVYTVYRILESDKEKTDEQNSSSKTQT